MTLAEQIAAAVEAADFGTPTAAKRGRRAEWPYVPVINLPGSYGGAYQARTRQIKGKAFATRQEAVDYAADHIRRAKEQLAIQLADPRMRALRESYDLPREIGA